MWWLETHVPWLCLVLEAPIARPHHNHIPPTDSSMHKPGESFAGDRYSNVNVAVVPLRWLAKYYPEPGKSTTQSPDAATVFTPRISNFKCCAAHMR